MRAMPQQWELAAAIGSLFCTSMGCWDGVWVLQPHRRKRCWGQPHGESSASALFSCTLSFFPWRTATSWGFCPPWGWMVGWDLKEVGFSLWKEHGMGGCLKQGEQTGLSFSTGAEIRAAKADVRVSIVAAGGREKPWDTSTGPKQQICGLKVIHGLGSSWKTHSSCLTLPSPKPAPPHQGSLRAKNLDVLRGAQSPKPGGYGDKSWSRAVPCAVDPDANTLGLF